MMSLGGKRKSMKGQYKDVIGRDKVMRHSSDKEKPTEAKREQMGEEVQTGDERLEKLWHTAIPNFRFCKWQQS